MVDFLAEGDGYCSDGKVVHKVVLIKMIKVLFGEIDVSEVENWLEEQGIREADDTVCELFDQSERKGRKEGRTEGRMEGIACGEANCLIKDVENAMKFFKVTLEKACGGLGKTVNGY